jgi:glycosyltransferase involved in cell wall biosynthesis
MAAGLPVIGTTVAGATEAIQHGKTGLLVPPEDIVALADAITALGTDTQGCDDMGRAARARAEVRFGWRAVAEAWLDLTARIAASRAAP